MSAIPREFIDPDAEKVLRRLRRYGHTAYLVGGCVRDLLLRRAPKDFDIATSATPQECKNLFRNCRVIGRRFRLAHIFFGSKIIETSTFRANPREGASPEENEELLIRRDNVFGTAEEDARRRDFTINGLFYDIEEERVIDYVGGLDDLHARLVRTIGDPEIRFPEDPVRILRAIKFAARLGFDIEPDTYAALLRHESQIHQCAAPRVLEEIYRLMRGGAARRSMELLLETGVANTLAPELVSMFQGPPSYEGGITDGDADQGTVNPFGARRGLAWRALDELDALLERTGPKAPRLASDVAAEVATAAEAVPVAIPDAPTVPGAALENDDFEGEEADAGPPHHGPDDLLSEPASNALLLCVLVAPFVPEVRSDRPGELFVAVDDALTPLAARLRVSRRDAERARQILLTQKRLAPSKRKRGRPMALVRRDYFVEALTLYELMGRGSGELGDEARRWRQLWRRDHAGLGEGGPGDDGPGDGGGGAEPGDGAQADGPGDGPGEAGDGKPRRKRRRGGRRRRRQTAMVGGVEQLVAAGGGSVPVSAAPGKNGEGGTQT